MFKCLEAYPTLHKVPDNSDKLYYSDHLAVYALLEIDEKAPKKIVEPHESIGISDDKTQEILHSAFIIVEETIQRIQRQRIYCLISVFIFIFVLFSFNGDPLSNSHFYTMSVVLKNLLCMIGIVICIWFIVFGKPVERNALSSVQNAMRLRLRIAHFSY